MQYATDMTQSEIYRTFDMLDIDGSGTIDFNEFYLLLTILIAAQVRSNTCNSLRHTYLYLNIKASFLQDGEMKQFIYRHSRTVFDLLDRDSSQSISGNEFEAYGFFFNLKGKAVKQIFNEFDVSGDRV